MSEEMNGSKRKRTGKRTNVTMLIVLCTVCSNPLQIPKDLERDLLHCESLTCPHCRQKSDISKELKQNILQHS